MKELINQNPELEQFTEYDGPDLSAEIGDEWDACQCEVECEKCDCKGEAK